MLVTVSYFLLQFVADGVFKAELNEFFTRELAEDGYSGVEVRVTPTKTEIIILATRTQNVLGEKGPTYSWTHLCCSEALQLPRQECWAICREGSNSGSLCYCTGRISTIQAYWWTCFPGGMPLCILDILWFCKCNCLWWVLCYTFFIWCGCIWAFYIEFQGFWQVFSLI